MSDVSGEMKERSNMKKAAPALTVFILAVLVRGGLQLFGGPGVGDVSWITTFASIAASWLGLQGGISEVVARVQKVEKNTNGKSDAERTAIAQEAAGHVIAQLVTRDETTGVPPVVQLSPVVPSVEAVRGTSPADDR